MSEVSSERVEAVLPAVAETIAEALACDVAEVSRQSLLVEDLGAESIDFLDIVFRLEQGFGIQIPRGQIVEEARGDLSEDEFETNGVLTDDGLDRLRTYLTEVPRERLRAGLKVAEIPALFTVETFCKIVVRAQDTGPRAEE
jgi:acyl carrier protein